MPPASSHYNPPLHRGDSWRPYRRDHRQSRCQEHHSPAQYPDHYTASHHGDRARSSSIHGSAYQHPNAQHHDNGGEMLPKHFPQPLTCFYWANNGYCTKSDAECLYAHHDTGYYAAPPIRLGTDPVAVAGTSAARRVDEIKQHEEAVNARAAVVAAREQHMAVNEQNFEKELSHFHACLKQFFDTLHAVDSASDEAKDNLVAVRDDLVKIGSLSGKTNPQVEARQAALLVQDALSSMSGLKNSVSAGVYKLKNTVGFFEQGDDSGHTSAGFVEPYTSGSSSDNPIDADINKLIESRGKHTSGRINTTT